MLKKFNSYYKYIKVKLCKNYKYCNIIKKIKNRNKGKYI